MASFKKDFNGSNCQHFNCRPVNKCKFLSSNLTDSFSFTSSSLPHVLVPSSHASKNESLTSTVPTYTTKKAMLDQLFFNEQRQGITKEAIATYSEDQLSYKDDNTTIKPRKGVDNVSDDSFENVSRSSIKPRKGVKLDGVMNSASSKSKVKPRKGVGPYQSHSSTSSEVNLESTTQQIYHVSEYVHPSSSLINKTYNNLNADDLVSALQKVFEDDTKATDIKPSATTSSVVATDNFLLTSSVAVHSFTPTPTSTPAVQVTSSLTTTTSSNLQSSLSTTYLTSSSVPTPGLATTSLEATVVNHTPMPFSSSPTILEHSKLLFQELPVDEVIKTKEIYATDDSVESENERKYKSSMHLVLSLVFGLLVLFSVFGVVAKRVYDGWMRRHYRRMDFLIDGMYNGYE